MYYKGNMLIVKKHIIYTIPDIAEKARFFFYFKFQGFKNLNLLSR